MPGSWDHCPLGSESSGKHITNRLEDGRVPAGDNQAAESRPREIIKGDLCSPGKAAAHENASCGVECRGQGIGQRCLNSHEPEEAFKELARAR